MVCSSLPCRKKPGLRMDDAAPQARQEDSARTNGAGEAPLASEDCAADTRPPSTLRIGLSRYLTPKQLCRLDSVTVGIAGAGGLGSNCAMLLARSGIRRFVLVDHDSVDASNLNRQFYFTDQVYRAKVAALRDNLLALDDTLDVGIHRLELVPGNLCSVFAGCAVVVEALDGVAGKKMLAEAFMGGDTFFVSASGMAGWGGPDMRTRHIRDSAVVVGDFQSGVTPGMPPMAPRVMMAAAMQADAVLTHLLGPCCQTG